MTELRAELSAFQQFLSGLDVKAATLRAYRWRIRLLESFIASTYTIEPNVSDLENVVDAFLRQACQTNTINATTAANFLSTFKLLSQYLGLPPLNLLLSSYNLSKPQPLRKILNEKELQTLLTVAAQARTTRSLSLVLLFLTTPIKIGACTELRLSDLQWSDGQLRIATTTNNSKTLQSASPELRQSLQAWLLERNAHPVGRRSDYLFFGQHGEKLTTAAIDASLKKIGWRAGLQISSSILQQQSMLPRQLAPGQTGCIWCQHVDV